MASTKPTILLVPGSFCPSALFFDPVANQLRKAGYSVIPIELLTVGPPSTAKPATMEDDAARIHGIVEWLLDNGKDVLIAMNSYGGIPTTQACQGLSKKERDAGGKIGGQIIGLVYMSALLVQNNENLAESLGTGAGLPDYVKINGDYMTLEPEGNAKVTFSDLPVDVGQEWVAKMPGHATVSFMGKLTSTSHHHIPITFVLCTNDQVLPPSHQRKMIEDAERDSGSKVTVIELDSGHTPHVSHPEEIVQILRKAAGEV